MSRKKSTELTSRQLDVLGVLRDLSAQLAYPPSVREISAALGFSSPSTAKHHLDALENKGYVRRAANLPRAIEIIRLPPSLTDAPRAAARLTPEYPNGQNAADLSDQVTSTIKPVYSVPVAINDGEPTAAVPLLGRIAAGSPILAEQNVEEVFTIPQQFTGKGELFMLEVSGDSMTDAAICSGDWVIVRRQPVAQDGEIIAALLEDEATVKVLSHRDGHRWLLPRNSNYPPILGDNAVILGKIVTVIRSL